MNDGPNPSTGDDVLLNVPCTSTSARFAGLVDVTAARDAGARFADVDPLTTSRPSFFTCSRSYSLTRPRAPSLSPLITQRPTTRMTPRLDGNTARTRSSASNFAI